MTGLVEVLVGLIGRPHGVRGEVAIVLRTDEPERRFAVGQSLRSEEGDATLTVAGFRRTGDRFLVRFADIADRTSAEGLRGVRLVADVDPGETPGEAGAYYDRQLVGLAVLDAAGRHRGQVSAVVHGAAQDLLEVQTTDGGLRLVPFVAALVPEVDVAAGRLRLADVGGLLSDDEVSEQAEHAD